MPVNVSDEGGPLRPGDLLTMSSMPAHAMKATPVVVGGTAIYPTGGILGKALEPLPSGTGKIKVLLTVR